MGRRRSGSRKPQRVVGISQSAPTACSMRSAVVAPAAPAMPVMRRLPPRRSPVGGGVDGGAAATHIPVRRLKSFDVRAPHLAAPHGRVKTKVILSPFDSQMSGSSSIFGVPVSAPPQWYVHVGRGGGVGVVGVVGVEGTRSIRGRPGSRQGEGSKAAKPALPQFSTARPFRRPQQKEENATPGAAGTAASASGGNDEQGNDPDNGSARVGSRWVPGLVRTGLNGSGTSPAGEKRSHSLVSADDAAALFPEKNDPGTFARYAPYDNDEQERDIRGLLYCWCCWCYWC